MPGIGFDQRIQEGEILNVLREGLPNFTKPPLDEVALGVQFNSIGERFGQVVADFREGVKELFPNVEYQSRLSPTPPAIAPNQMAFGPTIQFQPLIQNPFGRVWLVTADNSHVIQLQDDRFIFNWRHALEDYPRFEYIVNAFWERFRAFRTAAVQSQLGILPQQVEVSYFNWIPQETMSQNDYLLTAEKSKLVVDKGEIVSEAQNWSATYLISEDGLPQGRLDATSQGPIARISRTNTAMVQGSTLNLSFRAPVAPGANDDVMDSMIQLGRRIVVSSFSQLTTPKAHQEWGRTDV